LLADEIFQECGRVMIGALISKDAQNESIVRVS
jgi:hypothetical protein